MWTFLVLIVYLCKDLKVQFITTLISYVTACALVSTLIGLMCASLAMVVAFKFNLKIYSKVQLE